MTSSLGKNSFITGFISKTGVPSTASKPQGKFVLGYKTLTGLVLGANLNGLPWSYGTLSAFLSMGVVKHPGWRSHAHWPWAINAYPLWGLPCRNSPKENTPSGLDTHSLGSANLWAPPRGRGWTRVIRTLKEFHKCNRYYRVKIRFLSHCLLYYAPLSYRKN